ncbi:MAG TPA: tRNA (adenosine(37)-N6)-threonylcarbamoyltransferase complex dimerization subunit type 1 TsaB [Bdellovibrionales bacterium]|nr:tRNA (adenosine(37)-N6)-threonylcarbamoyltransferase complex dimerization subunit type 1 TsaB [Bdellovibrionales bacterium]
MLILSIECSTLVGGVALSDGERVLAQESWSEQSRAGEFVVAGVQKLFEKSGRRPSELQRIAVDIGPGRFTGVRVAVNTARSLGYSLGLQIAPFDSLRILAEQVESKATPVLSIINAHKNMVYASMFEPSSEGWRCTHAPAALTIPELEVAVNKSHICVGEGFEVYESQFSPALREKLIRQPGLSDHPKVQCLSRLALKSELKSWNDVQPLYIRASEAEEKLKSTTLS